MRLTASQLRNAVTDSNYRLPVDRIRSGGPSTDSALRGAIRVFHEYGIDAARTALVGSLKHKYWRSGRGLTMAGTARTALDTYISLATGDGRQAIAGKSVTYLEGEDEITVNIDVVLLEPVGYTGRLCLPGPLPGPLTQSQRALIAAPATFALADELEDSSELVLGVEVWELRSGRTGLVTRAQATRALPEVSALLDRLR